MPLCTCAILALPMLFLSILLNFPSPISCFITFSISLYGTGGVESTSLDMASTKSPGKSVGEEAMNWP